MSLNKNKPGRITVTPMDRSVPYAAPKIPNFGIIYKLRMILLNPPKLAVIRIYL